MRLREVVATLAGAAVLVVPAAAMGSTLIGSFSNGNVQGANSDQSGTNGSGGAEFSGRGLKFVDGSSKPNLKQSSTNAADNSGVIGGGDGTLIGNGSQQNGQGINSEQVAKKGTQISMNVESGSQIIGLTEGDAIIGSPTQASTQAENSVQAAAGRPGGGTTVILGPTNKGPLTETSLNMLVSCQVVIGSGGC